LTDEVRTGGNVELRVQRNYRYARLHRALDHRRGVKDVAAALEDDVGLLQEPIRRSGKRIGEREIDRVQRTPREHR